SNSAGKTNSTSASTIRKANAICKGAQPVRVEVDEELGSPSTCGNLLQSKARPSKKRCKRAWTCHVMAQASPPPTAALPTAGRIPDRAQTQVIMDRVLLERGAEKEIRPTPIPDSRTARLGS